MMPRCVVKHQSRCCCVGIFLCDKQLSQETLSQADYPPECVWASSNQLKILQAETEVSQGRRNSPQVCTMKTLPEFPACCPAAAFGLKTEASTFS